MTEAYYKRKEKELQEQYAHWASIRNEAIKKLNGIIKKSIKLEEKYYGTKDDTRK